MLEALDKIAAEKGITFTQLMEEGMIELIRVVVRNYSEEQIYSGVNPKYRPMLFQERQIRETRAPRAKWIDHLLFQEKEKKE